MMDYPLLVRHVAERAETVYADREIVSRTADGIATPPGARDRRTVR